MLPCSRFRRGNASSCSGGRHARRFGAIAAVVLAFLPMPASAQPMQLDPGFNGGVLKLDRFAGSANADFTARAVVEMDDGDVVVVGEVPTFQQPDNENGLVNIGLVRYDRSGNRVPWPYTYGFFGNEYLVHPNSAPWDANGIESVDAAVRLDSGICVLATHGLNTQRDRLRFPKIYCFDHEGDVVTDVDARGALNLDLSYQGVAMHRYAYDDQQWILLLARSRHRPGVVAYCTEPQPCYHLMRLRHNGFPLHLGSDRSFGEVLVGGGSILPAEHASSLAVGLRGNLSPLLHVGMTLGERVAVRTYGDEGTLVRETPVDYQGIDGRVERDPRIAVEQVSATTAYHHVYVASSVDRGCRDGIGVAKLTDEGRRVQGFGTGGIAFYGGSSAPAGSQACEMSDSATPLAITVAHGRIGIAGYGDLLFGPYYHDLYPAGLFASADATDGTPVGVHGYPLLGPGSQPMGGGWFYGIAGTGAGQFTLVGDAREDTPGGRWSFATARVGSPDPLLMRDGFED